LFSKTIFILAHNIRSLYNIGSIFRTADAARVDKIILTGYSGSPPQLEIDKTALGATKFVNWEYQPDPLTVIADLKLQGFLIVALEKTKNSIDYRQFKPRFPLCLVLGHEVLGVDKKIIAQADTVIELPMYGQKTSLNVAVAFGISVYKLREIN
jgi:tRNA G18 (ribose-2'-O)-methylase SpoU